MFVYIYLVSFDNYHQCIKIKIYPRTHLTAVKPFSRATTEFFVFVHTRHKLPLPLEQSVSESKIAIESVELKAFISIKFDISTRTRGSRVMRLKIGFVRVARMRATVEGSSLMILKTKAPLIDIGIDSTAFL